MLSFSHTDIILRTSFRDGGDLYRDLVKNARIFIAKQCWRGKMLMALLMGMVWRILMF